MAKSDRKHSREIDVVGLDIKLIALVDARVDLLGERKLKGEERCTFNKETTV